MPIYYGQEILELAGKEGGINKAYVGKRLVYSKLAQRYHCIFRGNIKDNGEICKVHETTELKFRFFYKISAAGNLGFSSGGFWTEANIYEWQYNSEEEKYELIRVFHDRKPNPTDPAAGSINRTTTEPGPLEVSANIDDVPDKFVIAKAEASFTTSSIESCTLYLDKSDLTLKLNKVKAESPAGATIEVVKVEQYY